jgi:glycosyltransferase involved in cell wall biosynthesis
MKILLVGEFSGLQNELKGGIKQLGHDVTLAAANDFFKNLPSDINLGFGRNVYSYKFRQLLYPFLNLRRLAGYDVVHLVSFYIVPRSTLLNLYIWNFLKSNNGVVTLSGAGSDPFFTSFSENTMLYSPIPWEEKFDRKGRASYMRSGRHLSGMHECMKVVDGVIPIAYEYYSTFLKAGYADKLLQPIPIPINHRNIKSSFKIDRKVLFFHGLNRYGFKGTFLIEEAFARLTERYPNDVQCIISGGVSLKEYLSILSKVNVSVDQVFSYSLGMNALYSMAQGKVVCGGVENESSILYNGELPPAFNMRPSVDEIYNTLVSVLDHRSELSDISERSEIFVKKHHDSLTIAGRYVEYWSSIMRQTKNTL